MLYLMQILEFWRSLECWGIGSVYTSGGSGVSNFAEFVVRCCDKNFLAKRFRVKPYLKGVQREEFKIITCPVCGQEVLERMRICKKENGSIKRESARLAGNSASFYLNGLEVHQIFNNTVQKGSQTNFQWHYYRNNKQYDLNDKRHIETVNWQANKLPIPA